MKTWTIKPSTTKMLASLYGVSRGVMDKHIDLLTDKVGLKTGNYYMTNQVIAIIENLGPPPDYDIIFPHTSKKKE